VDEAFKSLVDTLQAKHGCKVVKELTPTDYVHPALREMLATWPELMQDERWREHIDLDRWRERGRFAGHLRTGHWKNPKYKAVYDGKYITEGLPDEYCPPLSDDEDI